MKSKNEFELLKINMNESQELKITLDLDYLTYILLVRVELRAPTEK